MAPPSRFFVAGGTLRADAPCYLSRRADEDLHAALSAGEVCYVLTARQMGKSSLMVRAAQRQRAGGASVAMLDLTALGRNVTPVEWYHGLISRLGRQLDLEDEIDDWWASQHELSPVDRWSRALAEVALPAVERLVVFIDEIDTVLSLPFDTDELFSSIRELYTRRATDPALERLTFCLAGVATPSDLIHDKRTTPFNIGGRIDLADFTREELAPLGDGLGGGAHTARILDRIHHWTNGHPYLTQRLASVVAREGPSVARVDRQCAELFLSSSGRDSDDNLLFVRDRILRSEKDVAALLELYGRVRRGKRVPNDDSDPLVGELRLAGILSTAGDRLVVRNRIYARCFDRHWVRESMPDAELRRQRRAYWRGVSRAVALAGLLLVALSVPSVTAVLRHFGALDRLIRFYVSNGTRELDGEDPSRALPWFVQAVEQSEQDWLFRQLYDRDGRIRGTERARLEATLGSLPRFSWAYTHESPVHAAALSPDGRIAASGDTSGALALLDATDGRARKLHREAHRGAITHVAFSPDSKLLATSGLDGRVRVWSAESGELLHGLEHGGEVVHVAFGPGGEQVVSSCWDRSAYLWRLGQDEPVRRFVHDDDVVKARFDARGERVLTASADRSARIWPLSGGDPIVLRHDALVTDAVFSPDGGEVATATMGRYAHVWDASTGREISKLEHLDWTYAVAFHPELERVATASKDGSVQLWELRSGLPVFQRPIRQGGAVTALTFSPAGDLVTASVDGTVGVWNVRGSATPGLVLPLLRHGAHVRSVSTATSRAGALLSASDDGIVRLWRTATGPASRSVLAGAARPALAALSPSGAWLLTADPVQGARVIRLDGVAADPARIELGQRAVERALFAGASDRRLVTAGAGQAAAWDLDRPGAPVATVDTAELVALAVSDGGEVAAYADIERALTVWPWGEGSGAAVVRPHPVELESVSLDAPGERVAFGDIDGDAWVWSWRRDDEPTGPLRHERGVTALAFSPDGQVLATGSRDGTARIFDASGTLLHALPHGDTVDELVFSRDGRLLAALGMLAGRQAARVWEVGTGERITPPVALAGDCEELAFNATGTRLLLRGERARVWDLRTGAPLGLAVGRELLGARFLDDEGQSLKLVGPGGIVEERSLGPSASPWSVLRRRTEAYSGLRLDAANGLERLDPAALRVLFRELDADASG